MNEWKSTLTGIIKFYHLSRKQGRVKKLYNIRLEFIIKGGLTMVSIAELKVMSFYKIENRLKPIWPTLEIQ